MCPSKWLVLNPGLGLQAGSEESRWRILPDFPAQQVAHQAGEGSKGGGHGCVLKSGQMARQEGERLREAYAVFRLNVARHGH